MTSATIFLSGSLVDFDGTMLIHLAFFVASFLVLNQFVFKPLLALFEAREDAIDGARREAKKLQKEADEQKATFDNELKAVRLSAGEERDRLRNEGKDEERRILDDARSTAQRQLDDANKTLNREAENVRGGLQASIPVLANEIASKLLGREVA